MGMQRVYLEEEACFKFDIILRIVEREEERKRRTEGGSITLMLE